MSRTIDERIVQMTFNNQEFENRARTTISTLDRLKQATDFSKMGESLLGLSDAAKRTDLSSVSMSLRSISEGFSVMEEIAIGALRRVGDWAVQTGAKLLSSLTIEPFRISWGKYDEGIAAEQAIMSAVEGKLDLNGVAYDMDAVVERVDKLKWFADETSYSITQMTNAVGQFTAAGQDLDMSVEAVMGIANACADAGVSTQKAESAFIGFSKAIGSGTLTLGTWNMQLKTSGITNSERFRKTLLDSAVAMGTLEKTAEGTWKTLEGKEVNTANFTEFLKDGIITSEALIHTLQRYADTTETVREIQFGNVEAIVDLYKTAGKEMSSEMSDWVKGVEENGTTASDVINNLKKAYEELGLEVPQSLNALRRAQEAISFSQAMEATAEAVTSQFSNIYHLMVGNYEEAKELWSSVADEMNGWFVGPLYDLVDTFAIVKNLWNELGDGESTTQVIALWTDFATVVNDFAESISAIWNEIFEVSSMEETARGIFDFIEGIRKGLQKTHELFQAFPKDRGIIGAFQSALSGLLSIIRALGVIGKTFIDSFITPLGEKIKPIFDDIIQIITNLGDALYNIGFDVADNLSPLQKILGGVLDILDPIISAIGAFVGWIKELTSQNSEITVFSGLFQTIGNVFEYVGKAVKGTANLFKDLVGALGTIFDKLKDTLGNLLSSHGSDVAGLAEGGFLAYLAVGLTKVVNKLKGLDLQKVLEGIMGFFKKDKGPGLIESIKEVFDTLTNSIKTFTESIKVKMIETIGNALVKLAAALLIISLIDADKMASSLGMVFGVLSEALAFMAIASQLDSKNMASSTKALQKLGFALLELSVALKIMSSLNPAEMTTALVGMGFVLLELGLFFKALSNMKADPKTVKSIASTMGTLGFAMIEIAAALKIMSTIDGNSMAIALGGMTTSIAVLGTFIAALEKFTRKSSGKKIVAIGASLTLMSTGLIALAAALKIMSTIDMAGMGSALEGLVLGLGAIGLFVAAMSKVGGGSFAVISASMLLLSTALLGLGAALALMGSMSMETITKGLTGLAGALVIIGMSGALFGTVAPLMLLFATALGAFGLALTATAQGIMQFVAAYALLSAVGGDLANNLLNIFVEAVALIIEAIPGVILGIIQAVLNVAGELVNLVSQLIDIVIQALTQNVPKIIEAGFSLLISLLTGIRDNLYEVVTVAVAIIEQLALALGDNLPILIDAGFKLIIDLINGLAESIRNNAGDLGAAIGNLASAIIEGIIGGLISAVGSFGEKMIDFGRGLVDGIRGWFDGSESTNANQGSGEKVVSDIETGMKDETPTLLDQTKTLGNDTVDSYKQGVDDNKPTLLQSITTMGEEVVTEMDVSDDAKTSGESTLGGLYNGLTSPTWLSNIAAAGRQAGRTFMDAYNSEVDINSPSKEMEESGQYTIAGLVKGLSNATKIEETGHEIGAMVLNSIRSAIEAANSILDDSLNPTITPVLDLSNIQQNAGAISSLFGANASLNSALAINSGGYGLIQNGEKPAIEVNIDFNIDNSGKDITDLDISRWGRQITDEVNIRLGKLLGG